MTAPATAATARKLIDIAPLRRPARTAAVASLAISLLTLIMPLYFTQIYDRVLPSRSGATLIAITAMVLVAIALNAAIDLLRNLIFTRASATIYASLEAPVFAAQRQAALAGGSRRRARALDDLEQVRAFLASPTPGAMVDLIFMPILLIALFLISPVLGGATVILILLLLLLALLNRSAMARVTAESVSSFRQATDLAEAHLRAVEPAVAMGFAGRLERSSAEMLRHSIRTQMDAAARTGGLSSIMKGARQGSQTLIVGLAAWLALSDAISPGAIFAVSILFGRAMTPIDQLIGSWKTLFQARDAWQRLEQMLAHMPATAKRMALPAPRGEIAFQDVIAAAPGDGAHILRGVSFALRPGEMMGIIGASGSGKSSLARVLLGLWPVRHGEVRFDGAELSQYDPDVLGQHVGYLPQTVELIPGTIAQNICRFGAEDGEGVIAAARSAGVHDLIISLPQGYNTVIGSPGFALSGGQRQRVGLARALYGSPSIVLFDEPETALDHDGERALAATMEALRQRGATIVLIAHQSSLVMNTDKLLVLQNGTVRQFGATADIIPRINKPADSAEHISPKARTAR
ncbi:MAG: type I secretion system permease/ATPase [Sphingobium sp.]|uniref:type I secretion system permease/ATPase n=1 Tax=Sphingobium sp. TaxID=1912891 RepID=UPI0029A8520A|nr:type I secretion system permease/ATPase [Sphingobium sp.]MDX3909241.1 type I secretion system permease/ATPase [Sphingobium sp.]